jgi:hypothetical protein
MLVNLDVYNRRDDQLVLPIGETENGYTVRGIEGLDPVDAEFSTSSFATMDGNQYQAARRGMRPITITLGIEAGFVEKSVRELRKDLYSFFMTKSEVRLVFTDLDGTQYQITGRVESMQAPQFTNDPRAVISIACFDPDFYGMEQISVDGQLPNQPEGVGLLYEGTVEAGLEFQIFNYTPISGFMLQQDAGDGYNRLIEIRYDFIYGDYITINTIPGRKSVLLNRESSIESILYARDTTSQWPTLQPGLNTFRLSSEGEQLSYSMVYTPKFGGL